MGSSERLSEMANGGYPVLIVGGQGDVLTKHELHL